MDKNPGKVPAGTEYDYSHLTCLPHWWGMKFLGPFKYKLIDTNY
jgi:hypothetical protein